MRAKVTLEDINSLITDETYTVLPSGKVMICELTLTNGFTVTGKSAIVSKSDFVFEKGAEISRRNAVNEIWQIEGYRLQEEMYQKGKE